MNTPIQSSNYAYSGEARSVLTQIKIAAKNILKSIIGTHLEGPVLKISYLDDQTTITFHLATANHMNVRFAVSRSRDVSRICKYLEKKKIISKIHEKESSRKTGKKHEHAFDVLTRNMNDKEFAEHILVLPSAIEEAKVCEFEYDSPLDTNLQKLVTFAKLKRNPEYAKTLDEHLALNHAGLGHFAHAISQTARLNFPEDYTADYKGKSRIFEMHVTIGKNFNPKTCMSIYMDWDPEIKKLVIARFGRHGRGA